MARRNLPLLPEGARITGEITSPVVTLWRLIGELVEKNGGKPVAFSVICDAWEAIPGMRTGAVNAWKKESRPGHEPEVVWSESMKREAVEWRVGDLISQASHEAITNEIVGGPAPIDNMRRDKTAQGLLISFNHQDREVTAGRIPRNRRLYAQKPGVVPWVEVTAETQKISRYRTPDRPDLVTASSAGSFAKADIRRAVRAVRDGGKRPTANEMWDMLIAIAEGP